MTDEQIKRCIGALFKMAKASVSRGAPLSDDEYLEKLICEADGIRPLSVPLEDLRAGFVQRYSPQRKKAAIPTNSVVVAAPTFKTELVAKEKTQPPVANIEQPTSDLAPDSGKPGRASKRQPKPIPKPPINVEFILHLLLTRDEQDAVIGDLLERYVVKHGHLGKWRTDVWFCAEVIRSVWPLLKRAVSNVSGLILLGEWLRRMTH